MKYTEAPINILNMSIEEIQQSVDLGIINYETIAKIYLERIQEYNDEFMAIISVNENIVEQAKKLDEKYKQSGRTSMLYGIPIILKDNIDYVGLPTTAGAKGLKDNFPKQNATIVQNLLDAGVLIIGKANMSEFAFSARTSSSSYGTVKNAYDTTLTAYGSSGGTAVAVSTGMAVAGLGTDTNSSIRVPSSAANLIGLRPTYSLLSSDGIINYDASRDTAGPMTKYTSDNAILLEVLTSNLGGYTQYENNVKDMKIGVVSQFVYGDETLSYTGATKGTDAVILTLFNSSINKLKESGAQIVYIDDLYNEEAYDYYSGTIGGWTMCHFFNEYIKNTNGNINSFEELVESGEYIQDLPSYEECCNDSLESFYNYKTKHLEYKEYVVKQMERYGVDVLAYPTTKNKIATLDDANVTSPSFAISPVTGMPAISIPMGFSQDKLPYGIEVLAKDNKETQLYAISNILVPESKFTLSELAPNLYEIDDDVTALVELYKNNIDSLERRRYKNIKNEIRYFFGNYNSYDNQEQVAISLVQDFNKTREKENKHNNVISGLAIIVIIILALGIIRKVKNCKKVKKRKGKINSMSGTRRRKNRRR